MNDFPARMLDEYQNMQRREPDGGNREKIAGSDLLGMVTQKRRPVLRGRFRCSNHVLLYGRFANGVTQLRKLTFNSGGSPGGIF